MKMHYYNEHNAYRAAVLRERIAEGLLPKGVVDERDIQTVPDEDFLGYEQVHLFAGIGGFPLGLRLAGFPEWRRIVGGGFPCQDISNAGKRAGITGTRSRLWREMVRCIRVVRPELVFVENVAALLCRGMGEVLGDLAEVGYDARGDCVSAADVGAPHLRRRIWILAYPAREEVVAHAIGDGVRHESIAEQWRGGAAITRDLGEIVADTARHLRGTLGDDGSEPFDRRDSLLADATERGQPVRGESPEQNGFAPRGSAVMADSAETRCGAGECCASGTPRNETRRPQPERLCTDVANASGGGFEVRAAIPGLCAAEPGRERRGRFGNGGGWPVEPNVGRVAHGVPRRVDRLAALGDAIVPQCAAEAVRRFFGQKP